MIWALFAHFLKTRVLVPPPAARWVAGVDRGTLRVKGHLVRVVCGSALLLSRCPFTTPRGEATSPPRRAKPLLLLFRSNPTHFACVCVCVKQAPLRSRDFYNPRGSHDCVPPSGEHHARDGGDGEGHGA